MTLACALGLAVAVIAAAPEDAEGDARHPESHVDEAENAISARVLGGGALLEHNAPLYGVGVAYEREVAHGLLAIELGVEGYVSPEAHVALAELVVEKPVGLTDSFGAYWGAGPALIVDVPHEGEHAEVGFGGLMLVGVDYEFIEHWDLFVELDTAFLYVHAPVVEADVAGGVMWHF